MVVSLTLSKLDFQYFSILSFKGYIFDDLILTKEQIAQNSLSDDDYDHSHYGGLTDTDFRWKNGVIPYRLSMKFNSTRKAKIKRIIHELNEIFVGCIHFREYIYSKDEDYVLLTLPHPPKRLGICRSSLGRTGKMQKIVLSSNCQTHDIMHELLHCIGLLHEHSRPDRDEHVEVLIDNVKNDRKQNFEIFPNQWSYNEPYNLRSIMHYNKNAHRRAPGILTMKPKVPKFFYLYFKVVIYL